MKTEESKIFAELQKKSKSSYDKVKTTEVKTTGRTLPAGLKQAVGQCTGTTLKRDKNGNPYWMLMTTTIKPEHTPNYKMHE